VEPTDEDLVCASVAQPELFEAFFRRHHRRIWAYMARHGGRERADELAGDVFVTAFTHRDGYDPARGSVVGWLYGIATNLSRSRFRRQVRASRALARVAAQSVPAASPIDDTVAALDGESALARVRTAMAALSDRDRELIVPRRRPPSRCWAASSSPRTPHHARRSPSTSPAGPSSD
jgi:RNA polymerase sigma-70 factor (ECF subfamily)